jgi:hypothetical protein
MDNVSDTVLASNIRGTFSLRTEADMAQFVAQEEFNEKSHVILKCLKFVSRVRLLVLAKSLL